MLLRTKLFGKTVEFRSIRELMGKANEPKSGDELAGLAATSIAERVAAKYVLAEVTLETLRANPAVPYASTPASTTTKTCQMSFLKTWVCPLRTFIWVSAAAPMPSKPQA